MSERGTALNPLAELQRRGEAGEGRGERKGDHHVKGVGGRLGKTITQTPLLSVMTATELVGGGPTDLVGFLHQVDLVEFQNDGKVDGLLAHSTRLLVEVHLLEDLTGKHR